MKNIINKSDIDSKKQYDGTGKGIRLLLYSHDTLGIGHIRRNLKIARSLSSTYTELTIVLVTGSSRIREFDIPENVDFVELPVVKKIDAEKYESQNPHMSFEKTLSQRTSIILNTVNKFNPHILLIDHSPLGMKKEILPSLEWFKKNNSQSIALLGLRDILDSPRKVLDIWHKDDVFSVLRDLYDSIFVYGSKNVFDLVEEYKFPEDIKTRTEYLGYIIEPINPRESLTEKNTQHPNNQKQVLVTIGGGEWMGQKIIGNFLEVLKRNGKDINFESVIVAGPNVPDTLWDQFLRKSSGLPVRMIKFTSNMRTYMERCDLVIASGGYNTVTEIMAHNKKAIIIPRAMFREEQSIRAERFSGLGLITSIHPDSVNPGLLNDEIKRLLSENASETNAKKVTGAINLDGTRHLAAAIGKYIASLLNKREKL